MAKQPYSLNPEPVRWSVVAPLFAILLLVIPVPAWIVEEFYSRDMYPWLQDWFTGATNLVPFAVLDVVLIGALLAAGFRTRRLINVARQRGIMDALWEAFRRVLRVVALVTILFYWAWGFNYRRLPLETVLPQGKAVTPSVELLQAAVIDANSLAGRLRGPASAGPEMGYPQVATELRAPLDAALKRLGRLPLSREGRPKYSLVLTPFFTWAGVTGMVNPLALESIVHPDLLSFERPFVLAHEWAHLSGHADEAEASAIGWLACMGGGPTLAYSASLYLIMEASADLPPAPRRSVLARLDPGVRADLDAIARRMSRERPRVQRTASRVYDEYLKANRVEDGAASYGRALALILSPPLRNALSEYAITATAR